MVFDGKRCDNRHRIIQKLISEKINMKVNTQILLPINNNTNGIHIDTTIKPKDNNRK